ncbi:MAG: pyridoxamine 5'-phosphate oxidase family protein [Pseudomonadota bacterium]
MSAPTSPFHSGELKAQRRAGAGDVAAWAGGFIRNFMPDQHRAFYSALPFLVVAGADAQGRIWTTIIEGDEGFIDSPDRQTLTLATSIDPQDPLAAAFEAGSDIGLLGIELAQRRRNRLSGFIAPRDNGLTIDIRQTFGNCPQYIHEREWRRVARGQTPNPAITDRLSDEQILKIGAADTLFIGTGHSANQEAASNGFDASHRGGEPGFAYVVDPSRIRIPDYAGNNFFNTIGNLLENPRLGLLFIDFETGSLIQISGHARVDWEPDIAQDPNARRFIDVTIDAVIERPGALSLRWAEDTAPPHQFVVTDKVKEAEGLTSLYLAPSDGNPLHPFQAGQHLPIELEIPGQTAKVRRTYSLSGLAEAQSYRLTIKRENKGIASRFLHDELQVGDIINARPPAGDFTVPDNARPLVLASAGVGLTPILAMLHAAAAENVERPVWFMHGARDSAHHALRDEVEHAIATRPNIQKHIFYSKPSPQDRQGEDYDAVGRVSADALLSLNAGPDAHYMLCGPVQFLSEVRSGLEAAGVPTDQIHFETFGPTG